MIKARSTGRYLLSHRSAHVQEPNTWGIWGGAIDEGETPERAVHRELKEELGIKVKQKLQLLYIFKSGTFQYFNYLIVVPDEFEPPELDDWETQGHRWCSAVDLPSPLHFGVKELVKRGFLKP